MLEALDHEAVHRWCVEGRVRLAAAQNKLDALNVFPVPDGDTGANMLATMNAVTETLSASAPTDMAGVLRAMSQGSLMGARGNSGIILSQLLGGMSEVLSPHSLVTAEQLGQALRTGVRSAYQAVSHPVEGTILSVARAAADAATGPALQDVSRRATAAALAAVEQTRYQLPALKVANVVDAAGLGWCLLLQALEHVVSDVGTTPTRYALTSTVVSGHRETGSTEFAFEVQFMLTDASQDDIATLRTRLDDLGDSVVIVGRDGLHKVHVHVNDVDAVLAAAELAGETDQMSVTEFAAPPGESNENTVDGRIQAVGATGPVR